MVAILLYKLLELLNEYLETEWNLVVTTEHILGVL